MNALGSDLAQFPNGRGAPPRRDRPSRNRRIRWRCLEAGRAGGPVRIAVVALSWLWTRWRNLLAVLLLVILFVPIKRYALPGNLPFDFELYRLVVAVIVLGWGASLLVDRRVRLRQSGLEWPLFAILLSTIASVIVNPGRVSPLAGDVLKQFTFLLTLFSSST